MSDHHEDPAALRDRLIAEAAGLLASSKMDETRACLRGLSRATIDDRTVTETDKLFDQGLRDGRRLVATCDPNRTAGPGEQVVIYGNYPHFFENLLVNNVARRHVSWFWNLKHDVVESHPSWDGIGPIVIVNQVSRLDRLDSVLNELARVKAPFDRIVRLPAVEMPEEQLPGTTQAFRGHVGCLKSHIAALELIGNTTERHAAVIEDDFSFTSDLPIHLHDLRSFVERDYDYWVCLLGTSKYGPVAVHDDLLVRSLQPCTNTEAYLVSRDGVRILREHWKRSLEELIATRDHVRLAADRSWVKLQPSGKFFVFRRKMGFQASSYSSIEGQIARYFD